MKTIGRTALLLILVGAILSLSVVVEIIVDKLTLDERDLNHLIKHGLGNVGTLMMGLALFGYMAKKKFKKLFPGALKDWLTLHELFAVVGAIMVAIHTGAHFSAFVPLFTMALTLVCVISGLIGRRIYFKAKAELSAKKRTLQNDGFTDDQIEEQLAWDTVTANMLSKWRVIHRPFAGTLLAMVILHIASALFFGG